MNVVLTTPADPEPVFTWARDSRRAGLPYVIRQNGQDFLYSPSWGAAVMTCTALNLFRERLVGLLAFTLRGIQPNGAPSDRTN
jgi:hypothetical protein